MTADRSGFTLTPDKTADGCTLTAKLQVDNTAETALPLAVLLKDKNGHTVQMFDIRVVPTMPPTGQVDVQWKVLPWQVMADSLGRRVADLYFGIQVAIGNNSGHDLQLATFGFRPSGYSENITIPTDPYQFGRASLEREQLVGRRAFVVNTIRGLGPVLTASAAFLKGTSTTALQTKVDYETAINIFSNPFEKGIELVWPDRTVRHLIALDTRVVRDNAIVPSNAHVTYLALISREAVECPKPTFKMWGSHPACDPSKAPQASIPRLPYSRSFNVILVTERLGTFVLEGRPIQYLERVRLIDTNGLGVDAPPVLNSGELDLERGQEAKEFRLVRSGLTNVEVVVDTAAKVSVADKTLDPNGKFVSFRLTESISALTPPPDAQKASRGNERVTVLGLIKPGTIALMRPLLATLFAVSLLAQPNFSGAGAHTPGGKPILDKIKILSHVAVPMRDGVKLYADIYLPAATGKYPVLVVRTPYGTQRDGVHVEMVPFAQNGFAVVMQDVRGRYESEGQWEPFRNEGRDGYDTIEWAAKQPWSNGKVASQGGSYLGHVQWAAMSLDPPSLVAAIPRVASTNLYRNWITFGGAYRLSFNYGWGVVRMPHRIMQPQYWHASAVAPEELRYENILWNLPLKTGDLASSNTAVSHYRDWLAHDAYDEYWKQISDEEHFDKIRVPLYTQGGWFDIFLAGTINGYTGVRTKGKPEARNTVKMWIGPWGHGPSQKFGEVDFGPTANLTHPPRELRWYSRHLKGEQNGVDSEPRVEIFYMGANKWKGHDDWPVPGTEFKPLYLTSGGAANSMRGDGTLSWNKTAGRPSDTYHYDPNNPVMTLGGNNCCGTPTLAGPYDQRPIERRGDVLVYSSGILREPLAIAGPVKMKLWAATDGPDTDWMVKLVDVYPNGYAMNIAEGMLRSRFHKGFDKPELLKPNEAYEFEVDMVGTANVFQPGHQIRIDITSSNFPQFDRNLNTGEKADSSKIRVARNTVFHTAERASAIILPVVPLP